VNYKYLEISSLCVIVGADTAETIVGARSAWDWGPTSGTGRSIADTEVGIRGRDTWPWSTCPTLAAGAASQAGLYFYAVYCTDRAVSLTNNSAYW